MSSFALHSGNAIAKAHMLKLLLDKAVFRHRCGCDAAAALLILDASGRLQLRRSNLWTLVSAWTATLLFCCQPIAQLARNLAAPETVSSLSLATVLLATTGNSMMVPRALFTKDVVWSVGSIWGSCLMGLGNLACLAMAQSYPSKCVTCHQSPATASSH